MIYYIFHLYLRHWIDYVDLQTLALYNIEKYNLLFRLYIWRHINSIIEIFRQRTDILEIFSLSTRKFSLLITFSNTEIMYFYHFNIFYFDKSSSSTHTKTCLYVCTFFMGLLKLLWHTHNAFRTQFSRPLPMRFVRSHSLHCGSKWDLRKWLMANCFWNQQKFSGKYDCMRHTYMQTYKYIYTYKCAHTHSHN